MYEGKAEYEYDLIIFQTICVDNSFAGEFKPASANPFRRIGEKARALMAKRAKEDKEGWALIGRGLKEMSN